MSADNPIYDELEHVILHAADTAGAWFHPHREHASQAPSAMTVTVKQAPSQEDPMSLATDAEQAYIAAKNKLGEFEQALPALVAQAHKLEGNPLADVALRAAEAATAGTLPGEALAIVAKGAGSLVDDLIALYNPATAAPAPAQ